MRHKRLSAFVTNLFVANLFVTNLWEKQSGCPSRLSPFSLFEKVIFLIFCFFEIFYRAGFACVSFIKQKRGGFSCAQLKELDSCKVISIGNLSVGGTGKSVVVSFLYQRLAPKTSAIVLRGYGREKKSRESVVVGPENFESTKFFLLGDEATMFVKKFSATVAVGKNRVASCKALARFCKRENKKINYIFLDDAYQNFQIKKDYEILLLDARKPFGNGHCLPAGPLREKNFSRADCIVLTHADEVLVEQLEKIKKILRKKIFSQTTLSQKIFSGRHAVSKILQAEETNFEETNFEETSFEETKIGQKIFLAVAGIGSFSGFVASLKQAKIKVKKFLEFPDHHAYTKKDLANIIDQMSLSGCDGIITTQKDWQKLSVLFDEEVGEKNMGEQKKNFYILDIEFQFLSDEEDKRFFYFLHKKIS